MSVRKENDATQVESESRGALWLEKRGNEREEWRFDDLGSKAGAGGISVRKKRKRKEEAREEKEE